LPKDETRALLERLDAAPDGWKQCALAFLEAQAWQRTFRTLLPEADQPVSVRENAAVAARRSRGLVAAVAVCGIAIGAGLAAVWQSLHDSSGPRQTVRQAGAEGNVQDGGGTSAPVRERPPVKGLIRVSNNGVTETAYSLLDVSQPELAPVELSPKPLTDYDRQLWERKGYRIEQHRKVVFVELADGERFRFPVEWTNYRYVGQRVY
jgi:hypothetical protein